MRINLSHHANPVMLAVATTVSSFTLSSVHAQERTKPSPIILGNDDFKVSIIAEPAHLIPAFGPRFDNTAMVSQVTLKGKTFLAREGLTDEFGIDGTGVLGFKQAPIGGSFLKIGVGELVRPDREIYGFWHPYKVKNLFSTTTEMEANKLTAYQQGFLNERYGYQYQKSYQVDSNLKTLTIGYSLKNIGKSAFSFTHYNHNWFSFSGRVIAPPYFISTGFSVTKKKIPDWLKIDRASSLTRLRVNQTIKEGVIFDSDLRNPSRENWLRIGCDGSNQQIEVRGNFDLHKFALYAEESALCPETFVRIRLKPGRSFTWKREYQFSVF